MVPPPQRLTLISDATTEFPNNKNNSFKVRLPNRLQLQNDNWYVALMSISVPDGRFDNMMFSDIKLAVYSTGKVSRLSGYDSTTGKYSTLHQTTVTEYVTMASLVNSNHPVRTGVEFWNNVVLQVEQTYEKELKKQVEAYHAANGSLVGIQYFMAEGNKPTLVWEGESLVLPPIDKEYVGSTKFAIHKGLAKKFGFLDTAGTGPGPNANYEYSLITTGVTDKDVTTALWNGNHISGPAHFFRASVDIDTSHPKTTVLTVSGDFAYFSRSVKWTFFNLNSSFQALLNTQETVMIYSDLAQSSVVGAGNFPLLRQVELQRKGQGRVTVEPLYREWVPLRSRTIDMVEIELATASGPLTQLSTGKTIVMVGLQQHV